MNISPQIRGYQNSSYNKQTNFTAFPRSTCKLFKGTGEATVYQLEKVDVPFLEKWKKGLAEFFRKHEIEDEAKQEIIEKAIDGSIDFLSAEPKPQDKVRVLVAIADGEPYGIGVGNGLKIDKKGKFHYSSRKNHGPRETEWDFFATWGEKKRKGVGSALYGSYLKTLKPDGFDSLYIRSEVPWLTGAETWYEGNGARKLRGKIQDLDMKHADNDYVTGSYFDPCDPIVRMKVKGSRLNKTIESISKALQMSEAVPDKKIKIENIATI